MLDDKPTGEKPISGRPEAATSSDLKDLSEDELQTRIDNIRTELKERKKKQRAKARQEIRLLAKEVGLPVSFLAEKKKRRK